MTQKWNTEDSLCCEKWKRMCLGAAARKSTGTNAAMTQKTDSRVCEKGLVTRCRQDGGPAWMRAHEKRHRPRWTSRIVPTNMSCTQLEDERQDAAETRARKPQDGAKASMTNMRTDGTADDSEHLPLLSSSCRLPHSPPT